MAALPAEELWKLWQQEQITSEMAIGQLIQNQVDQQSALKAHHQAIANLQTQIDPLFAQPGLPAPAKPKEQPPRRD